MSTMNDNMNDLQLEDVEDYSADYPPVGYPNADANMAPMGTSDEMYKSSSSSPKYRRGMIIAKLKKNKWTVALLGVVIIILISILVAMAGKGSSSQSGSGSSSSAAGVAPVTVDGASVDQDVLAILKASIQSVYERHGLDTTVLLENAGETPQRKALHWMALDRNVNSMEHTEKMQRFTLATLFYSTNMVKTAYEDEPEAWRKADNWMTNAHSCDWMGVVCGTDKAITSIALAQNRLSGKLPHDLTFIAPKLVSLDFTSNLIVMRGDDYDSFSRMVNLKTLLMDDNYLYYDKGLPPQFKNMVNLEKIRLSYNLFEGVLDSETAVLGSMTKLTHLEMESNFFSGTMPSAIANMNNLMYLYLRRNSMKFNLDFMKAGQLGNLFALWIDSNDIRGTIPTEIGLMTSMASLSMTNATLHGTIPTEIGNLTDLQRLWLYSNHLNGTIPTTLAGLEKLEVVELHNNSFTGEMPEGICTAVSGSGYEYKSLTSDCLKEVKCDSPSCCTECF